MPIRFYCNRCRQLLGIASRKAGSEIRCPECGIAQVVPSEEAAAAAMAMDQFAKNREPLDSASVVVYDDEPAAIETPPPQTPVVTSESKPSAATANQSAKPLPHGMILYPRRTLYVQGLLFLTLAAVAFAAGYFIGLGDGDYRKRAFQEEADKEPVAIRGKLVFNPGTGQIAGDEGAVVIVLPDEKLPERRIPIQGLRPQDPPPQETHEGVRKIVEFGGVYARADASGEFFVVVTDRGRYRLLIISAHVPRGPGIDVDEADLNEMERYFHRVEELINRYEYRWSADDVTIGFEPVEINFGRDRQD